MTGEEGKYHTDIERAQGPVIGDHNIVIQQFISGITSLPTGYATRIQNFITAYLGTPDQPVPFGGREADLARLDEWLDDSDAPPYLMLAAPAGRGKSALLVRWSTRLIACEDIAVVFIPVSIRFRTNLASVIFAALTARLAALHGDQVPGSMDTSVEVWRGMAADYLARPLPDGRRLVVILDGVDEAADWGAGPDLFPLDPPTDLRVILSARYLAGDADTRPWLRRLEWDRPGQATAPNLLPLTREGVGDVLRRMGFPLDQLGARVDIVSELHRLSEGDPLLVRLYVDDLWGRGEGVARLQPEDLRAIRPGLEGYLEKWWEDQHRLWGDKAPLRDGAVRALLSLLACALGPLSQRDVLHLVPSELGLDTWALEGVFAPLARFVVGDGKEQGYVFGHPRLGAYFYEQRLTPNERQRWEEYFLTWGEETLVALRDGSLAPQDASSYLVQYYGAHLERAGASPEALLALVSDGWRRAWEALQGAYSGFLGDLERAWRAAERANAEETADGSPAPYLGGEVRCALCEASIRTLLTKVPPALIGVLVESGLWTPTQGLTYAKQVQHQKGQSVALARLAPHLSETLLWEALAVVRDIDGPYRAEALAGLAPHLSEPLSREALAVAREIEDAASKAMAVARLATRLAELGYPGEALVRVLEIEDDGSRGEALVGLGPHLPESLTVEALAAARVIGVVESRVDALVGLARHVPKSLEKEVLAAACEIGDDGARAEALAKLAPFLSESPLQEALTAAQEIGDEEIQAEALAGLSPRLAQLGYSEEALAIARKIRDERNQAEALAKLAPHLAEPLLREALAATRDIKNKWSQAEALAKLIPQLAKLGCPEEALMEVREIGEEWKRAEALSRLASYLPAPLRVEALAAARELRNVGSRMVALARLAPHLPESLRREVLREALADVRGIQEDDRVDPLVWLAPYLPGPLKEEALAVAREIGEEKSRVRALIGLIPYLPEYLKRETLAKAWEIGDERRRTWILTEFASYLPEALLRQLLSDARKIEEKVRRAWVLSRLAPRLPKSLRGNALREALLVTGEIEDSRSRAEALARLAILLAESGCPDKALDVMQWIEDEQTRVRMLDMLIPHLPETLVYETLKALREIKDEGNHARVLSKLSCQLGELGHPQEALAVAQDIEDEWRQLQALVRLIPHIPDELRRDVIREALTEAREIGNKWMQAEVLVELSPHLTEPLLREALKTATEIGYGESWLLVKLLPRLADFGYSEEALAAARGIADEESQGQALAKLVPRLARLGHSEKAFVVVMEIGDEQSQAEALVGLAPFLSEPLLRKALIAAQRIGDAWSREWALAGLVPRLAELGYVDEALATVRVIGDEQSRAEALAALAPYLPESLKRESLVMAREFKDEWSLAEALAGLAPHFWGSLKKEALVAACEIGDEGSRARVLAELAEHMLELSRQHLYLLWQEALRVLAARTRHDLLADLRALAPVIAVLGGQKAVDETFHAIQDMGRWWP